MNYKILQKLKGDKINIINIDSTNQLTDDVALIIFDECDRMSDANESGLLPSCRPWNEALVAQHSDRQ